MIAIIAISSGVPAMVALAQHVDEGCRNYWYGRDYCEPLELSVMVVGLIGVSLILIFGYV